MARGGAGLRVLRDRPWLTAPSARVMALHGALHAIRELLPDLVLPSRPVNRKVMVSLDWKFTPPVIHSLPEVERTAVLQPGNAAAR